MNLFGMFKQKYTPEEAEIVLKTFDNVLVTKGSLTGVMKHTLVITNKKFLLSYNSLGGYPGFRFYFDPSKKVKSGWFSSSSVIKDIKLEGDSIIANSIGAFKYIKITDKERGLEIYNLIQNQIAQVPSI